jgi:hypothetical protein
MTKAERLEHPMAAGSELRSAACSVVYSALLWVARWAGMKEKLTAVTRAAAMAMLMAVVLALCLVVCSVVC